MDLAACRTCPTTRHATDGYITPRTSRLSICFHGPDTWRSANLSAAESISDAQRTPHEGPYPQYRVREQDWALDRASKCSLAPYNLIPCGDYIGYLIATSPPSETEELDLAYIGDLSADTFLKLTEAASSSVSPPSTKTRLTSQVASDHCICELVQPSRRQVRGSMAKTDDLVNTDFPEDWWRWHRCLDFEQLKARLTERLKKE